VLGNVYKEDGGQLALLPGGGAQALQGGQLFA
jgi:hypothetical protein